MTEKKIKEIIEKVYEKTKTIRCEKMCGECGGGAIDSDSTCISEFKRNIFKEIKGKKYNFNGSC